MSQNEWIALVRSQGAPYVILGGYIAVLSSVGMVLLGPNGATVVK